MFVCTFCSLWSVFEFGSKCCNSFEILCSGWSRISQFCSGYDVFVGVALGAIRLRMHQIDRTPSTVFIDKHFPFTCRISYDIGYAAPFPLTISKM